MNKIDKHFSRYSIYIFIFEGGVAKKSKNQFCPIFSPFQAIPNNFDFLHFWHNFFRGIVYILSVRIFYIYIYFFLYLYFIFFLVGRGLIYEPPILCFVWGYF